MGLKKAFDDAEKRGETRCSVCLSTVHSKEYHENAAQSRQGQAEVSALTEEQRHLAVSALRHYRTACSQSGTAFADNIDSTIVALLATAPEQADQLVERWEQTAEHGEGTPATDNFYFRCAMERCAAELKAAFRATPSPAPDFIEEDDTEG